MSPFSVVYFVLNLFTCLCVYLNLSGFLYVMISPIFPFYRCGVTGLLYLVPLLVKD